MFEHLTCFRHVEYKAWFISGPIQLYPWNIHTRKHSRQLCFEGKNFFLRIKVPPSNSQLAYTYLTFEFSRQKQNLWLAVAKLNPLMDFAVHESYVYYLSAYFYQGKISKLDLVEVNLSCQITLTWVVLLIYKVKRQGYTRETDRAFHLAFIITHIYPSS